MSSARYVSSALNAAPCASLFPVSRSSLANDCSARDSLSRNIRLSSVTTLSRNRGSSTELLKCVPRRWLFRASSISTQSRPWAAGAITDSTNGLSPLPSS